MLRKSGESVESVEKKELPFGSRIAQRVGTQGRKGEDRRKGKGDGVKKGREGGDADNAGKSTTGWLGK